ncbi:MAG: glycosyl hydrolase 108 family protein [Ruegeria sp.]
MSRKNFNACLKHILKWEGGYVDHPKDPGGATNHGITHKTLASFRGKGHFAGRFPVPRTGRTSL